MKREESQNIEYKESWHDNCLAWICGYANANGGAIYFGIDDKTKQPIGLKNAKKLMEDIPNKIRNALGVVADVSLLNKSGKDVIMVKVKTSKFPVCYHGEYHYRTGSVKMQLTGVALTEFLLSKSGMEWDAMPTLGGFKKEGHAFTGLIAKYSKVCQITMSEDDFVSFGLALPDGRLTNTGALFADDCPLIHSRVFCTRWNGCDMTSGYMDANDNQEYCAGLLSMLKYAEDFVRVNSRHSWHKLPTSRIDFVEYPERAVHEALVNAFIHRSYIITGSEVHVDVFDDRLEITSPGGMPSEKKIEDYDVHRIPSVRRNKLLADMCERLRLMERRGSGFKKIFEDYEKVWVNIGNRKPILESHSSYFRITLPNLLYGFTNEQLIAQKPILLPTLKKTAPPAIKPSETLLNEVQRKVIKALDGKVLSISQLASEIGIKSSSHIRKTHLRMLIDMGLIEYTIPNKPKSRFQKYRLTAKAYEMTLKLVHREPLNGGVNEEMSNETLESEVLKILLTEEGIKRDALKNKLSVSLRTIARVLASLENDGKIIFRGSKKTGGYYIVDDKK